MKCSRLQLLERSKSTNKRDKACNIEKPRRYCQKRLVNPNHEEDHKWKAIFERYCIIIGF